MSDPFEPIVPPPPPAPVAAPPAPEAPARRRSGMVVGAVLAALVLVAGAIAFVLLRDESSAEARPLALSFTQGQSQTYTIHQTMQGEITSDLIGDMPLDMDMTQVLTWEVTSVDDDGLATIEVGVSSMSGTVNGVEMPDTAGTVPPVEIVIAPDGRVVSAGGLALGGAGQTQGFGFPGMGQLTPILPDDGEAVAPGDSWDKEFSQDFPFGEGTISYTATSTYDRIESVNGRDAAVIVTDMSVPMDFTMDFGELLDSFGDDLGATGATGFAQMEDASVAYSGRGDVTQTSFVDLDADELLRSESSGEFDIVMTFSGIVGFDGTMGFAGTFTQEMEVG